MADKRRKMLTMRVTEDEHQHLLVRCDDKQLATCLDEKPSRAGKLPSISPVLLRQLAGMGNNLNQIARQVNACGGSGHDREQVVAALMAIDAWHTIVNGRLGLHDPNAPENRRALVTPSALPEAKQEAAQTITR